MILLQPSNDIGGFSDAMVVLFNTASLAADLCARFLPERGDPLPRRHAP